MSDVELPMCFESALSVPKISKLFHFVTSLLIAYMTRGLHRLDCLNINKCVSFTKSLFAGGIQTKYHTFKRGWSVIWRVQLRQSDEKSCF